MIDRHDWPMPNAKEMKCSFAKNGAPYAPAHMAPGLPSALTTRSGDRR